MSLRKDEEIKRRGCKENPPIIKPSCELMRFITEISYYDCIIRKYEVKKLPKEIAISRGKSFLLDHFQIHNVVFVEELSQESSMVYAQSISPFSLPIIEEEIRNIFSGCLKEFFSSRTDEIFFKGIILGSLYTEQTPVCYIHEIAHTQLDSIHGIVGDYYNSEILSIFLELFYSYSYSENLLNINNSHRILELVNMLESNLTTPKEERDKLLESSKYICSTLKAFALFIIYYYGSNSIKKEMLSKIQSVFNGNTQLEDLLSSYDITYESSQDEKMLKKYFNGR